jgi:uncharacterized protein
MNRVDVRKTPEERLAYDYANLYLGNLFTVDTHLTLPLKGLSGSNIVWKSSDPSLIREDGFVCRPNAGCGNGHVTLTATLTYGTKQRVRPFNVTILELAPVEPVVDVIPISVTVHTGALPQLPTYVITKLQDNNYSTSAVTWAPFELDCFAGKNSYTLTGSIADSNIAATAQVTCLPLDQWETLQRPELKVLPFTLDAVKVTDNVFTDNCNRCIQYLLSCNTDQMLYVFRQAAGLDTNGATPLSGWDSPQCNLRGHTTGHYLSALAQAFQSTHAQALEEKLRVMIDGLEECQDALADTGLYTTGFLSGYSEDQFIMLEALTPYPKIWAPYYTLHKIMAGLLDAYHFTGNEKALNICLKMGHFVYSRLSQLKKEQRNAMWATYIAGEFGGLNEVMAKLFGITGDVQCLEAARFFDNDRLYLPMSMGYDTLGGLHANQHIPQIIGAMQLYLKTGEPYYYEIARNFWSFVTTRHLYSTGGTGSGEMFKNPNQIARYLTDKTAETCATYNLLKLTCLLYTVDPLVCYMDYYEGALYNHILATQDQSAANGGSTYFMPTSPGAKKDFFAEENSCCHGTGMENHTKYQEAIYFASKDQGTLFINLYAASILNWKDKGITITQSGDFLTQQEIQITILGCSYFHLKLRVPKWSGHHFGLLLCGHKIDAPIDTDGYITLSRQWATGDTISLSAPFSFTLEKAPDQPEFCSLFYGPLLMVAISDSDSFLELPIDEDKLSDILSPTADPLVFRYKDLLWKPNFMVQQERYHAYFKMRL